MNKYDEFGRKVSGLQDAKTRDVHNETGVDWQALAISRYNRVQELLNASYLVESRSHINADGSYTVDESAMDAICKAITKRKVKNQ